MTLWMHFLSIMFLICFSLFLFLNLFSYILLGTIRVTMYLNKIKIRKYTI